MTFGERVGWLLIVIIPILLAKWLMMGGGQSIPRPGRVNPYLLGRAFGINGSKVKLGPKPQLLLRAASRESLQNVA